MKYTHLFISSTQSSVISRNGELFKFQKCGLPQVSHVSTDSDRHTSK